MKTLLTIFTVVLLSASSLILISLPAKAGPSPEIQYLMTTRATLLDLGIHKMRLFLTNKMVKATEWLRKRIKEKSGESGQFSVLLAEVEYDVDSNRIIIHHSASIFLNDLRNLSPDKLKKLSQRDLRKAYCKVRLRSIRKAPWALNAAPAPEIKYEEEWTKPGYSLFFGHEGYTVGDRAKSFRKEIDKIVRIRVSIPYMRGTDEVTCSGAFLSEKVSFEEK